MAHFQKYLSISFLNQDFHQFPEVIFNTWIREA